MVGLLEVAIDRALQVEDGAEDAALQPAFGEGGEEALHRVQPGAGGRREMEDEARMSAEPGDDLGVLVSGVVVEDDVNDLAGRDMRLDGIEETEELLVPVALHVPADHGSVEGLVTLSRLIAI